MFIEQIQPVSACHSVKCYSPWRKEMKGVTAGRFRVRVARKRIYLYHITSCFGFHWGWGKEIIAIAVMLQLFLKLGLQKASKAGLLVSGLTWIFSLFLFLHCLWSWFLYPDSLYCWKHSAVLIVNPILTPLSFLALFTFSPLTFIFSSALLLHHPLFISNNTVFKDYFSSIYLWNLTLKK